MSSKQVLAIFEQLYDQVFHLVEWLHQLIDDIDFPQELIQESDSTSYRNLLETAVVGVNSPIKPFPTEIHFSQESHQQEIILRVIEKLLRKKGKNVLTFGFRSLSDDPDAHKSSVGSIECYYPNNSVSHLQYNSWKTLLSRVGDEIMFYLLENTSVFLLLPPSCYIQVAGLPVYELWPYKAGKGLVCRTDKHVAKKLKRYWQKFSKTANKLNKYEYQRIKYDNYSENEHSENTSHRESGHLSKRSSALESIFKRKYDPGLLKKKESQTAPGNVTDYHMTDVFGINIDCKTDTFKISCQKSSASSWSNNDKGDKLNKSGDESHHLGRGIKRKLSIEIDGESQSEGKRLKLEEITPVKRSLYEAIPIGRLNKNSKSFEFLSESAESSNNLILVDDKNVSEDLYCEPQPTDVFAKAKAFTGIKPHVVANEKDVSYPVKKRKRKRKKISSSCADIKNYNPYNFHKYLSRMNLLYNKNLREGFSKSFCLNQLNADELFRHIFTETADLDPSCSSKVNIQSQPGKNQSSDHTVNKGRSEQDSNKIINKKVNDIKNPCTDEESHIPSQDAFSMNNAHCDLKDISKPEEELQNPKSNNLSFTAVESHSLLPSFAEQTILTSPEGVCESKQMKCNSFRDQSDFNESKNSLSLTLSFDTEDETKTSSSYTKQEMTGSDIKQDEYSFMISSNDKDEDQISSLNLLPIKETEFSLQMKSSDDGQIDHEPKLVLSSDNSGNSVNFSSQELNNKNESLVLPDVNKNDEAEQKSVYKSSMPSCSYSTSVTETSEKISFSYKSHSHDGSGLPLEKSETQKSSSLPPAVDSDNCTSQDSSNYEISEFSSSLEKNVNDTTSKCKSRVSEAAHSNLVKCDNSRDLCSGSNITTDKIVSVLRKKDGILPEEILINNKGNNLDDILNDNNQMAEDNNKPVLFKEITQQNHSNSRCNKNPKEKLSSKISSEEKLEVDVVDREKRHLTPVLENSSSFHKDVLPLLKKMISNHGKCPYRQLMNHYCPDGVMKKKLITNKTSAQCKVGRSGSKETLYSRRGSQQCPKLCAPVHTRGNLGNTTDKGHSAKLKLVKEQKKYKKKGNKVSAGRLLEAFSTKLQVFTFLRTIILRIVPVEFFGSKNNRNIIMKKLKIFISCGKYDKFCLGQIMTGLKVKSCKWLKSVLGHSAKVEKLSQFTWWLFDDFIRALLMAYFYITDTTTYRNRLFCYRKKIWQILHMRGLQDLMKKKMLQIIPEAKGRELLNSECCLGLSYLRFLPKCGSLRPIINMGRRSVTGTKKTLSINQQLLTLLHALKYHVTDDPSIIGSSMFGLDDVYQAWIKFLEYRNLKKDKRSLYFVKTDITGCFDSIKQEKLYEIIADILEKNTSEEYVTRRFASVVFTGNRLKRWFHRDTNTLFTHQPDFFHFTKKRITEESLRNIILVDQVVNQHDTTNNLLKILRSHLFNNIIKVGKQFYLQHVGISQGSVLSTMLCNLYYGHMERQTMDVADDELLMRMVDDFLFITPYKERAEKFLNDMLEGNEEYNCRTNINKILTNFHASDCNKGEIPSVKKSEPLPWCGLLINTETLETSVDYSRYAGLSITDTITFDLAHQPGMAMKNKLLNSLRPKCHGIFFDSKINSEEMIVINVYKLMQLTAHKFHAYLMHFPSSQRSSSNTEFFLDMILALSSHLYSQSTEKMTDRQEGFSGKVFPLSLNTVKWLTLDAFLSKLKQHHSVHSTLIKVLQDIKRGLNKKLKQDRILALHEVTRQTSHDFDQILLKYCR